MLPGVIALICRHMFWDSLDREQAKARITSGLDAPDEGRGYWSQNP